MFAFNIIKESNTKGKGKKTISCGHAANFQATAAHQFSSSFAGLLIKAQTGMIKSHTNATLLVDSCARCDYASASQLQLVP